jgi:hypothetical protein
MPPLAILLALILFVFLPASGIAAAVLAWIAFRTPVTRWHFVGLAVAIVLLPYLAAALLRSLDFALGESPVFQIPLMVGIIIVVVAALGYRREREESAARLRTEIQQ